MSASSRETHAKLLGSLGPAFVAVAYFLGAQAAFLIGTLSDRIFAPFWPPNIVLTCTLLFVPHRRWPIYIAAVFPAHLVAELGVGMTWPQLWVAFATNCAVAILSALGIRHFLGDPPWFDSFYKSIVYVLIAAVGSPALAALGGAFVRIAGGGDLADYWQFWEEWYLANALASLTLGAVLLVWIGNGNSYGEFASGSRRLEALVLAASLALTCIVAFKADSLAARSYLPAFLYLPLPLVLWAAVRFCTLGASAAILIVTITSISATLNGPTIFAAAHAEANVLALQLFLMALSVPVLLLGSSMGELCRAQRTTARLARFVLGSQDDERRRVAKSLHEGIGQDLVAATWIAERLQKHLPASEQPDGRELEDVLKRSMSDIRAVSYLLHPPLLDDGGLESALRARIASYFGCSGIVVELDMADSRGRLPPDVELTVFRLVEDALSNIKRHSGSSSARIRIERMADTEGIVLTIEDEGRGMARVGSMPALLQGMLATVEGPGLGLARMRERLGRVGGTLDIRSTAGKTIVRAIIPATGQATDRCVAEASAT